MPHYVFGTEPWHWQPVFFRIRLRPHWSLPGANSLR